MKTAEAPSPTTSVPRRLPAYVVPAVVGTLVVFALLLLDIRAGGQGVVRAIQPGSGGPAAALVAQDFPGVIQADGLGLDGQQFYAIARDPFHPQAVADSLDNARYRYQRPLYPTLAWLLHPSGGGPGLVWALIAVGVAGVLVGALALGALSESLRRPSWLALLYPLLPGVIWSLATSVADGLAVSLALLTIAAALRGRTTLSWCAAIAAVLTKETTILVPLAIFLARRRREDLPLIVLPGVVLVAWLVIVRLAVPGGGLPTEHLVLPFTGLVDAVRDRWLQGRELVGMTSTVPALLLGALVLVRKRAPVELRWVIGLQLAFLTLCSGQVLGNDFGGTRSALLLLAVAAAALACGRDVHTVTGSDPVYVAGPSATTVPV